MARRPAKDHGLTDAQEGMRRLRRDLAIRLESGAAMRLDDVQEQFQVDEADALIAIRDLLKDGRIRVTR